MHCKRLIQTCLTVIATTILGAPLALSQTNSAETDIAALVETFNERSTTCATQLPGAKPGRDERNESDLFDVLSTCETRCSTASRRLQGGFIRPSQQQAYIAGCDDAWAAVPTESKARSATSDTHVDLAAIVADMRAKTAKCTDNYSRYPRLARGRMKPSFQTCMSRCGLGDLIERNGQLPTTRTPESCTQAYDAVMARLAAES